MRARITGTGSYLPERVMTNAEVTELCPDSDPDWVVSRLGIRERRIAGPDEQTSDLAVAAAKKAIAMAGIKAEELDGIVCSVGTGDVPVPATACYIQDKLGIAAGKGFAFDVKMACAGAIGGTMIARGLVESGIAKNFLVVGTQIISRTTMAWKDRTIAPIFGDGAGAVIISASDDDRGFLQTKLRTDGSLADIVGQYIGGTKQWYSEEAVREERFDLIIMDIEMPIMDGLEAIPHIRKLPHGQNTPIIALTAHSLPEKLQKIHEVGGDDYLLKPFDEDKLQLSRYGTVALSQKFTKFISKLY